ncbi:MAG: hypothetical protein ACD_73C00195G0004 [uncultured bacterium]|nr:MAG: hypothetical protein ACD_73C00195G0004 [uncultured bacterium]
MKRKMKGTLLATIVTGLFFSGNVNAEEKNNNEAIIAQEAKICCEVQNGCGGKNGCGSKKTIKVKDSAECTDKKGQVVECSK